MNPEKIARKLVELRGNKTIKEVADANGISVSALSMYEAAKRIPRDEIKVRLADYYGVDVSSLFLNKKYTICVYQRRAKGKASPFPAAVKSPTSKEVRGMLNPNPEVSVNIFFLKRIRECLTEVIHDISEKESLTHGDAEAVKKILQLMDFTEKDHVVEAAEYRRSHPGIQTPARSDSD